MIYLLDVNALVALGFANHEFHDRVAGWVGAQPDSELATCSITELGFIRVLAQAPAYGLSVLQARSLLVRMKESGVRKFRFLVDSHDVTHLPTWVKAPKQITDGHLVALAKAHRGALATLDGGIRDGYLIPER